MQVVPGQSTTPLLCLFHVSWAQAARWTLVQVHLSQPRLLGPFLCLTRTPRSLPAGARLVPVPHLHPPSPAPLGCCQPWGPDVSRAVLGQPGASPVSPPSTPLSSSCSLPPLPARAPCQLGPGWRRWQVPHRGHHCRSCRPLTSRTRTSTPQQASGAFGAAGLGHRVRMLLPAGGDLGAQQPWKQLPGGGQVFPDFLPSHGPWLALQEALPAQESPRLSGVVCG